MRPIGKPLRRPQAGKVYDLADLAKPIKKKKKIKKRVYELFSSDGKMFLLEAKKEKKHKVNGKIGVWRTIRGKHYFFPDDKSGPIPPFNF